MAWHYCLGVASADNGRERYCSIFFFFSAWFSITVVFHWCDASHSIIVIAVAC
jgi:hypothetical protein